MSSRRLLFGCSRLIPKSDWRADWDCYLAKLREKSKSKNSINWVSFSLRTTKNSLKMSEIRFDGKVAIVTGAGGGM